MIKYELLVLARLLISQGRSDEALKLLESLVPIAEWRRRPWMLIESYALQALAWRARGDLDRAQRALERALSLAEPEGYVRILVDEGEPMRLLISDFRSRIPERMDHLSEDSAGRLRTYADELLAAFTPAHVSLSPWAVSRPQSAMIEPLTERELEVLSFLKTPLSLPEIADRLYISANTVRSHVKHIYAKLDVHARAEAVERAQELGLL